MATATTAVIDRRDMFILRNDGDTTLRKPVPGSFDTRFIEVAAGERALVGRPAGQAGRGSALL
jgi:hypothetical protein